MAQKKETKRNIKKNRVAAIVAAILALGMILSTATFVGGPMLLEIFAKTTNPPAAMICRLPNIADIENLKITWLGQRCPGESGGKMHLIMIEQTFRAGHCKGYQRPRCHRDLIDLSYNRHRLRLLAATWRG